MHTRNSTKTDLLVEGKRFVHNRLTKWEIMYLVVSLIGEWAPSLAERIFKLYFSPIFRGITSYVLNQLINLWALR
jgi:hypothetical protein